MLQLFVLFGALQLLAGPVKAQRGYELQDSSVAWEMMGSEWVENVYDLGMYKLNEGEYSII